MMSASPEINDMNKYKITISAIGYETTVATVEASTKLIAKINFERDAIKAFAKHNAISTSDASVLGSISYEKCKTSTL
jgi:uncharacterized protein YdbL (DUF1318 family)